MWHYCTFCISLIYSLAAYVMKPYQPKFNQLRNRRFESSHEMGELYKYIVTVSASLGGLAFGYEIGMVE